MAKEIWLLDDERSFHVLFKSIFEYVIRDNKYQLSCFKSVGELKAEYSMKGYLPDILVVDINLKKDDGIDFIQYLSDNKKADGMAIYILTNSVSPIDIKDAYSQNIKEYISKPVTKEDIEEMLYS